MHSRHRDFWKEVRKLSNSVIGRRTNAPVIDGLSNDVEIAGLFSSNLKDILNSGCSSSAWSDLWNHHNDFAGAVCYAGDVTLIAPSASALRLMLCVCSQFASTHSLIFNASKTQLIKFYRTSGSDSTVFSFRGYRLEYSKSVTHLGHILSSDLSDNLDVIAVKQGMCCKANHMLTILRSCDPKTKTKLMQNFCLSLYGASLWMASSSEIQSLETAYNNLIRKIWNCLAIVIQPFYTV